MNWDLIATIVLLLGSILLVLRFGFWLASRDVSDDVGGTKMD